jgi:hypothetical protein
MDRAGLGKSFMGGQPSTLEISFDVGVFPNDFSEIAAAQIEHFEVELRDINICLPIKRSVIYASLKGSELI